jgi:flavin-dependent dehydrogenase
VDLLDFDVSHLFDREFQAAIVHTPTGRRTLLTRDGFRGHLVLRSAFDDFLLKRAREAGAEIVEGTEVVAIEQLRKGIRALCAGDSYKSHLLVGADGVNGIAGRELRIRSRWDSDSVGVCIKTEVQVDPADIDKMCRPKEANGRTALDLYFGLVEWGYGWCFPKHDTLDIGIGCRADRARNLRDKWEMLISHINKAEGLDLKVTTKTSARVPFGGLIGRYVARRSMLIGDAAGLVSPLSGEGISYAIESGTIAADVAVEAVRNKSATQILEYEHRLKEGLLGELKQLRLISRILYRSNKNIELICAIVDEDPVMREYMTDLLARAKSQSDLLRQIRNRLLLRHPLKAIRLGFQQSGQPQVV